LFHFISGEQFGNLVLFDLLSVRKIIQKQLLLQLLLQSDHLEKSQQKNGRRRYFVEFLVNMQIF
jgi:hypothetical protein